MRCAAFFLLLTLAVRAEAAEAQLAGATSTISPSLCVSMGPETLRCAGYGGVDVFLLGPETARTAALGLAHPVFPPLPVAGRLGRLVDWQVARDGGVLTGALRWRAVEGSAELVLLLRPPSNGAPGCLQAIAAPGVALAASSARRFRCGVDRPALAGAIPPRLRAALEPWLAAIGP